MAMERGMALTMWVDTIRAGCGGRVWNHFTSLPAYVAPWSHDRALYRAIEDVSFLFQSQYLRLQHRNSARTIKS
jgi:hypothetical protein